MTTQGGEIHLHEQIGFGFAFIIFLLDSCGYVWSISSTLKSFWVTWIRKRLERETAAKI